MTAVGLASGAAACGDNIEILCEYGAPIEPTPGPIEQAKFVAHAFGSPDGLRQSEHYTQSREGFLTSYANGFRAYEIDLLTLGDGTVAAVHDFHEEAYGLTRPFDEITRAELEGRLWNGKYEVLFAEDVIQLMVDHPDIWMILDTKWDHEVVNARMVELAPDASVRDRLVPHVTSQAHADALAGIYPFPEKMLARYWWDGTDAEVEARMTAEGIDNVMMWWNWRWNEPLQQAMDRAGYHVWVHSPEEADVIEGFIARGVGVYTNGYIACH
jgi:glycerophosphoryl diester phosphodiesterase